MANPTTNYGFVLPTPTDLVTDLPADFEVALQGVDTQMKTNADAAIAKTIVDAKGDLIAATGADAVSRLAVGTNDQILVADSTTATGLKWATPAGGSKSWSLINTGGTALSGTTTTITGISGKDDLLILIDQMGTTLGGVTHTVRLNSDTGNNYIQGGITISATPTIGTNSLITYDRLVLGDQNTNGGRRNGNIRISGANSSGLKAFRYETSCSGGSSSGQLTSGVYTGTSTISSISFTTDLSSFASGTIYVYGAA